MSETSFGLGLGAGLPTERLEDLELVSAGGQGLLYRATDVVLHRPVAVKVLTGSHKGGGIPDHVLAQSRMSWHPYVMTVHDAGVTKDGYPFLIMEFLEHGSCEQLRKRGPVEPDRALRLATQLGDALQAAHERQILHCDVKPSNVMLDDEGNARLGDFGSSRQLDRTATTVDDIQGSLMYLAPEILEGVRPSAASDVYSFALTIWTMLSGEMPWAPSPTLGEAIAVRLHSTRLSFESIADRPRLRTLLEAATDTDPERRPLLPELLTELRRRAPIDLPAPPEPSRSRRVLPWAAAVVALIAGGLIGYVSHPAKNAAPATTVATKATLGQFCSAYGTAVTAQLQTVKSMNSAINDPDPTYADIKAMMINYPAQFATAYSKVLPSAAGRPELAASVAVMTNQGLEDMALVDGLYRFQYDEGLIDQSTFTVAVHANLATSIYDTASAYATIGKYARANCGAAGSSGTTLAKSIDAAINTMRGRMVAGPLDRFFTDPRSLDLFNADQVDLVLSSAPGIFSKVFAAQTPWVIEVLEKHPTIRHLIFAQHLPEFIEFLNDRPDLIPQVITQHPQWSVEARSRFLELDTDQQATMTAQYGSTLHSLGILTSVTTTTTH